MHAQYIPSLCYTYVKRVTVIVVVGLLDGSRTRETEEEEKGIQNNSSVTYGFAQTT